MSDKEKNDWTNDSGYSDVFHNTMHTIPKINEPQEEYENDKLKARVKFLEESHYYDGYNFRNRLYEKIEIIKELETEIEKANNSVLAKWKENDIGYSNI